MSNRPDHLYVNTSHQIDKKHSDFYTPPPIPLPPHNPPSSPSPRTCTRNQFLKHILFAWLGELFYSGRIRSGNANVHGHWRSVSWIEHYLGDSCTRISTRYCVCPITAGLNGERWRSKERVRKKERVGEEGGRGRGGGGGGGTERRGEYKRRRERGVETKSRRRRRERGRVRETETETDRQRQIETDRQRGGGKGGQQQKLLKYYWIQNSFSRYNCQMENKQTKNKQKINPKNKQNKKQTKIKHPSLPL